MRRRPAARTGLWEIRLRCLTGDHVRQPGAKPRADSVISRLGNILPDAEAISFDRFTHDISRHLVLFCRLASGRAFSARGQYGHYADLYRRALRLSLSPQVQPRAAANIRLWRSRRLAIHGLAAGPNAPVPRGELGARDRDTRRGSAVQLAGGSVAQLAGDARALS